MSVEQGGLRLGVRGGGCSGLSYNIALTRSRVSDRVSVQRCACSWTLSRSSICTAFTLPGDSDAAGFRVRESELVKSSVAVSFQPSSRRHESRMYWRSASTSDEWAVPFQNYSMASSESKSSLVTHGDKPPAAGRAGPCAPCTSVARAAKCSRRFRRLHGLWFPKLNRHGRAEESLRAQPPLASGHVCAGGKPGAWGLEQSCSSTMRTALKDRSSTQYLLRLEGVERRTVKQATSPSCQRAEKRVVPPDLLEEVFELNMHWRNSGAEKWRRRSSAVGRNRKAKLSGRKRRLLAERSQIGEVGWRGRQRRGAERLDSRPHGGRAEPQELRTKSREGRE